MKIHTLTHYSIYNFICTYNPDFKVDETDIKKILKIINNNPEKLLTYIEVCLNLHSFRTLLIPTNIALKLIDAHR